MLPVQLEYQIETQIKQFVIQKSSNWELISDYAINLLRANTFQKSLTTPISRVYKDVVCLLQ